MSFTVATYNVLANAYINPKLYSRSPERFLEPNNRITALVEHIVQLQADVLCLQEVEHPTYDAIDGRLAPLGYTGGFARKGRDKPDGCATFFRAKAFKLINEVRLEYADGEARRADSGHVAHIVILKAWQRTLGIANTHLKWDPPDTPRDAQFGSRQIRQLLNECSQRTECDGWIVCGDLNVTENSDVVALLREAEFEFSHVNCTGAATCNPNRTAKMIDYVFHSHTLTSQPLALTPIDGETPLPGPDQPSDHLAVPAKLAWR